MLNNSSNSPNHQNHHHCCQGHAVLWSIAVAMWLRQASLSCAFRHAVCWPKLRGSRFVSLEHARPRGVWTASRSTPTDWWLSNGGMYHSVVNLFRACPGYVSKTLCSIATSYTGRWPVSDLTSRLSMWYVYRMQRICLRHHWSTASSGGDWFLWSRFHSHKRAQEGYIQYRVAAWFQVWLRSAI